jgi:hypothetical protein
MFWIEEPADGSSKFYCKNGIVPVHLFLWTLAVTAPHINLTTQQQLASFSKGVLTGRKGIKEELQGEVFSRSV